MQTIYAELGAERSRAHAKHGDTSMESYPWEDPTGKRYRILLEEVGEVAKEFNDADHDGRPVDPRALRKELVQVAAMAAAWADVVPRLCECSSTDGGSAAYHGGQVDGCPREAAEHEGVVTSPALCLPCLHGCAS